MTIDIHRAIGKLPFIPKKGFVPPKCIFLGPYNPLDDQIDNDKRLGTIHKIHVKPKNLLDRTAMLHDVCYAIGRYKNECDREMVKNIDNIPKNKRPFITPLVRGIINKKQQFGLSVNPNKILSQELHKPKRINFERRRVISNHIDHIWGIDLITMIKYSKQNNNYKYILTVIDFFSKHSWCYPLKNKNYNEMINSFKDIFKKSKREPNFIQSDEGSEFTNKIVQKFFNDNNIKWYHTYNRDIKCSICERFNRTILNKMYKNFTLNNNTIWIKDLNKLVKEYNNSYHRTVKMKPVDASKKSNENIVRKNYNFKITDKKPKFSIGDKVRISLLKNTFEKGYTSNWSEQTYVIYDIKSSNVHYYYLKDLNGNKIDGVFYEQELLKTNIKDNDLYIIEKIIKKIGNKYIVKWRGYDDSFNSYVNKNDIVKYV